MFCSDSAKKRAQSAGNEILATDILQKALLEKSVKVDLEKAKIANGLNGARAVLAHLLLLEIEPGGEGEPSLVEDVEPLVEMRSGNLKRPIVLGIVELLKGFQILPHSLAGGGEQFLEFRVDVGAPFLVGLIGVGIIGSGWVEPLPGGIAVARIGAYGDLAEELNEE